MQNLEEFLEKQDQDFNREQFQINYRHLEKNIADPAFPYVLLVIKTNEDDKPSSGGTSSEQYLGVIDPEGKIDISGSNVLFPTFISAEGLKDGYAEFKKEEKLIALHSGNFSFPVDLLGIAAPFCGGNVFYFNAPDKDMEGYLILGRAVPPYFRLTPWFYHNIAEQEGSTIKNLEDSVKQLGEDEDPWFNWGLKAIKGNCEPINPKDITEAIKKLYIQSRLNSIAPLVKETGAKDRTASHLDQSEVVKKLLELCVKQGFHQIDTEVVLDPDNDFSVFPKKFISEIAKRFGLENLLTPTYQPKTFYVMAPTGDQDDKGNPVKTGSFLGLLNGLPRTNITGELAESKEETPALERINPDGLETLEVMTEDVEAVIETKTVEKELKPGKVLETVEDIRKDRDPLPFAGGFPVVPSEKMQTQKAEGSSLGGLFGYFRAYLKTYFNL